MFDMKSISLYLQSIHYQPLNQIFKCLSLISVRVFEKNVNQLIGNVCSSAAVGRGNILK